MIGTNPYWLDITYLCLFASVLTVISYIAGTLLINVNSKDTYRKAFINTALGLFLIVDLYSCIVTGFKTVNSVSLLLIVFLATKNKGLFNFKNLDFKLLLPFAFIIPTTFILYSLYILPGSIQQDVKFYSKITYNLYDKGVENLYHYYNSYRPEFHGMTPYHYIELWLASLFKVSTGSLAIFSVRYFSYPFLISILSFGIISFSRKNKFLLFIIFISLTLFPLGPYLSFIDVGWQIVNSFWLRPNLITYYILYTLLYTAILDDDMKLFYVYCAIGMTFSFVIGPPLFVSLGAINLLFIIIKKETFKSAFLNLLIPGLSMALMLVLFLFFAPQINLTVKFSISELLQNSLKIWKAVVGVGAILAFESLLLPGALWLYNRITNTAKNENVLLLLVSILILIGVTMFQLLNSLDNAYQFAYFGYVGIGFFFILLITKVLDRFIEKTTPFLITTILICFVCLFLFQEEFNFSNSKRTLQEGSFNTENASITWVNGMKKYLSEHPDAKGGFLFSEENIKIYPSKARHCLTLQIGNHLQFLTDKNCNLPCISCRDLLLYDYKEENKRDFEKQTLWMDAFPYYTKECDPEKYLENKTFDFFVCHLDYKINNEDWGVIPDTSKKLKVIYRKP